MDATNGLKETTRVISPVASNTLSVNVFTAPGKSMVGERPRPFGEHDAVLVDEVMKLAEAEALADWVPLH